MLIGFLGSQAGLTNFQREQLAHILRLKNCSEFLSGDSLGSETQAIDVALMEGGVKIFSIFPIDNPKKRGFNFDPTKLTKHSTTPTDWIKVGDLRVRWFPIEQYLKSKYNIINSCALVVACPKEYKFSVQSATWKAIKYAWNIKKDCIIIPPVSREEETPKTSKDDREDTSDKSDLA